MAQNNFGQYGGGHNNGGSIDPNDLAMNSNYPSSYSNNYNSNSNNGSNAFSSGSALFGDDELLDGLTSPMDGQSGLHGQDFGGIQEMNTGYNQGGIYGSRLDQTHINGYSSTPDGDPIQSPFVHSFPNNGPFRQMHAQPMGNSLQSPISYSGSPLAGSELNPDDPNYLNAKARARVSQAMQRKTSNNRSPMTPKTNALHGVSMGSQDSAFGPQPIRTTGLHEKSPSGQWLHTPGGSMTHSYQSGFSSPLQPGMMPMNEVLLKGGTSMPAKLGVAPGAVSSQEMKRKRRRESHNLVERRRRDNINERIQDLSRLVPTHRLEDEKIRKLIQNGTPLSPTLTGVSSPGQATSGLAGPGARRAAGGNAGNITTGLPIEEKDKGPNKGDILNGAVSWTRDLMWMLHLKLQQQEELMNVITDSGGHFPFELTDDEKRMQTELMDAISKNESGSFTYSRTSGSGLRVPHHTDYRGESIGAHGSGDGTSVSPDGTHSAMVGDLGGDQYWNDPDDDHSGNASINFKEEDEYDMDITQ
jgi:hypothetical protein